MPGNTALPAAHRRQLAELILAESHHTGLGPGSRLPTERQLASELGASRTSVRHALAMLQADGYITREVGRGTFLRDGAPLRDSVPDSAPGHGGDGTGPGGFSPADVMTIRRLLEPSAMQLVVAWATATDFAEISRCLAGAELADGYDEFEYWDLALHRAIMAAAHSPLLTRLYAVIDEARRGQFWGELKRRSASHERQLVYQADHRQIVAALHARDADQAAEAMRTHLSQVASHLFGTAH